MNSNKPSSTIAPVADLWNSVDGLLAESLARRSHIYSLLLGLMLLSIACLPFIEVDLAIRVAGVFRPPVGNVELRTATSGRLEVVAKRENDRVVAGEIIGRLAAPELLQQLDHVEAMLLDKGLIVEELDALLAAPVAKVRDGFRPKTALLAEEYAQLLMQLEANRVIEAKALFEKRRLEELVAKGIAAKKDLDDAHYSIERIQAERKILVQDCATKWTSRLMEEKRNLAQVKVEHARLDEQLERTILRAPVAGTVVSLVGFNEGAYLAAGQMIGSLSPDGEMRIEGVVASRDCGHLRKGQRALIQVDAFPHTQWGTLSGIVVSLGQDLLQPADGHTGTLTGYKITVQPDSLKLYAAGTVAEARKGMTAQMRILAGRASLWNLIANRIGHWFDPTAGAGH